MKQFGIQIEDSPFFLPPYEWYNDTISAWTEAIGLRLINYTAGTFSHADYTLPGTPEYKSSAFIYQSIIAFEKNNSSGLNGFILLSHIGTAPERTDKFYLYLEQLIIELKSKGYIFNRIDEHLQD
jgi:peptidoglycan/xylan/chitin deacetylase (PgdA/CDA1 family)